MTCHFLIFLKSFVFSYCRDEGPDRATLLRQSSFVPKIFGNKKNLVQKIVYAQLSVFYLKQFKNTKEPIISLILLMTIFVL